MGGGGLLPGGPEPLHVPPPLAGHVHRHRGPLPGEVHGRGEELGQGPGPEAAVQRGPPRRGPGYTYIYCQPSLGISRKPMVRTFAALRAAGAVPLALRP